jgi:hypothetical protein
MPRRATERLLRGGRPSHRTALEREISLKLSVSEAGLKILAKLHAGRIVFGGVAGGKLMAQGHIDWGAENRRTILTNSGRDVIERARLMGW